MNGNVKALSELEQLLKDAPCSEFPQMLSSYAENTKNFFERYDLLRTHLGSKHDLVEVGALLASAREGHPYESLIHLNQHGKGHVALVMKHAAGLIGKFEEALRLSGFELFLLLCAIQIHDIGNISGRKQHTTSFQNDFFSMASSCFITEPGLKELIFQIARVHGGAIIGDKDTIDKLRDNTSLLNCRVRVQLLAAILRFADELADDCTRSRELEDMPEASKVFHAYSKSLHTVSIEQSVNERTFFIQLCFFLSRADAERMYLANGSDITLLEEVFNRTVKMERERRYCYRFLVPAILLTMIKVEISIQFENEVAPRVYEYTLKESGYPDTEVTIEKRNEIIKEVTQKGRVDCAN